MNNLLINELIRITKPIIDEAVEKWSNGNDCYSTALEFLNKLQNDPTATNYHILVIQNVNQTNTKPAKVKIISERSNQSVTISYDVEASSPSPLLETAINI